MTLEWLTGVGGWIGVGLGFALQAAGAPVPSVLLFPALAALGEHTRVPWWISGGVAGVSVACGHLLSYAVFTILGQPLLTRLTERTPALRRPTQRVRHLLAQGRSWLPLLGLRWLGTGYSQVFWLLGTMQVLPAMLLGSLFLNDLVWALAWAYAWTALTGKF
ncbi:MAG: hypothetical protein QME79_10225 [Bacillota bacterium]|nr:hypothetical protein [Bacillota bacterium]